MKINIIETFWATCDRVVLTTEDLHGIVEIQYPKEEPNVGYIWHLWVDKEYRKKGYATALLKHAEQHIINTSRTNAVLDWDRRDTPVEIYHWYERQGYVETEFNRFSSRLEKKLKSK